jgi:uncharacterized damage-inducible protein DinB
MTNDKQQLTVMPVSAKEPIIGHWLWAMEDSRERTRKALRGIDPPLIDWSAREGGHTIGTLLFHIAAIELDWVGVDVRGGDIPEAMWEWFPYEVRDEQSKLTIVKGESLDYHWKRLDTVRAFLLETYRDMDLDDFHRARQLDDYDVSPAWVLQHLAQHEPEHRGEIIALREAAEKAAT